jgi:uncharacterized protein (DUF1330 family)
LGAHEVLEGDWCPNRVVVIEFFDMETIKALSFTGIRPLIALRRSAATDVIIAVEGKDLGAGVREG